MKLRGQHGFIFFFFNRSYNKLNHYQIPPTALIKPRCLPSSCFVNATQKNIFKPNVLRKKKKNAEYTFAALAPSGGHFKYYTIEAQLCPAADNQTCLM